MNENIKIIDDTILSDNWCKLNRITFEFKTKDGEIQTHIREVLNRGDGAAILLYNSEKRTVILTSQFRLPAYMNESGSGSGMLIEACAGMLDSDNPEDCIKRETEEETGYKVKNVQQVFEAYMSPGALTEKLHMFIAEYDETLKVSEGGGLEEEQENIEVLEMDFDRAYDMISNGGIKDAKTILLLQYAKINSLINHD